MIDVSDSVWERKCRTLLDSDWNGWLTGWKTLQTERRGILFLKSWLEENSLHHLHTRNFLTFATSGRRLRRGILPFKYFAFCLLSNTYFRILKNQSFLQLIFSFWCYKSATAFSKVGLASGAKDNSSEAHFFATSPKPRWIDSHFYDVSRKNVRIQFFFETFDCFNIEICFNIETGKW